MTREIDPEIAIRELLLAETALANTIDAPRFNMALLTAFAVIALVLAALGLAAVIGYEITERKHEIGVRMALGARTENVRRLAMQHGLAPALIGVIVGVIGALGATQLASNMLYGVEPRDPLTFVGVVALLVLVALGAAWLPARRARVSILLWRSEPSRHCFGNGREKRPTRLSIELAELPVAPPPLKSRIQEREMLRATILGLCVLSSTGVLAQEPLLVPEPTHRFIRELQAIVEQSAERPRPTVVGVLDTPGSSASSLLPLDIVLRVGQRPVTSIADALDALSSVRPGTSFDLVVLRAGDERRLQLVAPPPR